MKLSILIICVVVIALHDEIKFISGQDDRRFEWDLHVALRKAMKGVSKASIWTGRSLVNAKRITVNQCRRTASFLLNVSFALAYDDAEFFFYTEEKHRDKQAEALLRGSIDTMTYDGEMFRNGDVAIKYSYYCRDRDPEKLKDICFWATYKNRILRKRIKLNPHENPECEFRNVYIVQYKYETWRTLLRCPTISVKRGEEGKKADIFIMPIENSFPSRLMFYLFMRTPDTKRKRNASLMSQSQSQSIEYEARRASTESAYDLREHDRETILNTEPARHSLSEVQEIGQTSRRMDRASSSRSYEIEEETDDADDASETGSDRLAAQGGSEQRGALQHMISIRDNRRDQSAERKAVPPKLPRSAQSSIAAYDFGRTETFQKRKSKKYGFQRFSLPARRSFENDDEEELAKPKSIPLEIVNLIINRRHTIGRGRPQ